MRSSEKQDAMTFAPNHRQTIGLGSSLSNAGFQISGGSKNIGPAETISSAAEFSPRTGTTPVFESLKTNTVLSGNLNLENNDYKEL